MTEKIEDKIHDQLWGVRRSIRYHNRRRMFFDRYHIITTSLAVIFGSSTIWAILSQAPTELAICFAAAVTIFSTIDLVVGTSTKARLHHDLARRFIELEQKYELRSGEITKEQLNKYTAARLEIEADEPPILRVLDSICHNEMLRADGYSRKEYKDQYKNIRFYQRIFSQLFDINEHAIE